MNSPQRAVQLRREKRQLNEAQARYDRKNPTQHPGLPSFEPPKVFRAHDHRPCDQCGVIK